MSDVTLQPGRQPRKSKSVLGFILAGSCILAAAAALPLWLIETFIWAAKI